MNICNLFIHFDVDVDGFLGCLRFGVITNNYIVILKDGHKMVLTSPPAGAALTNKDSGSEIVLD